MIEVEMTSLEIAELTGKEHSNILRDIRDKLITRESLDIKEGVYINSRGKKYPIYILPKNLAEEYFIRNIPRKSSSLEKEYSSAIIKLLPNAKIEMQKSFLGGKYRVDMFIDDSFIVEIDEKYHESEKQKDKDSERIQEIVKFLIEDSENPERSSIFSDKWFKVFRIREGFFWEDVHDMLKFFSDEGLLNYYL